MKFSLWPACVRTHSFQLQLIAASNAGFTHLPIGLETYRTLQAEGLHDRDILELAEQQGITLGHFDGFSAWAPTRFNEDLPAAAKAVFDISSEECLEICSHLKLDSICATGTFNPGQYEVGKLADCFALFCQQADSFGIQVDLEFLPMWGIPTLQSAWDIYSPHQPNNAGILFDIWHFYRGDPNLELLKTLPRGAIKTVQLADAKVELQDNDLFQDCLMHRRLPGEGELDIQSVLAILNQTQCITNIGPEIFSTALDQLNAEEAATKTAYTSIETLRAAGFQQVLR